MPTNYSHRQYLYNITVWSWDVDANVPTKDGDELELVLASAKSIQVTALAGPQCPGIVSFLIPVSVSHILIVLS